MPFEIPIYLLVKCTPISFFYLIPDQLLSVSLVRRHQARNSLINIGGRVVRIESID